MKKILYVFLLLSFLGPPAFAQSGGVVGNLSIDSTDCTKTKACLVLQVGPSHGGATIKLSGTFSATVQFEASADPLTVGVASANWVALSASPSDSPTTATSSTTTGVWQVNVAGYQRIRVRISAYTSGTVEAAINLSTASARGGSGAGGSGTVTGTGASPQVAFWSSPTVLAGDAQFLWDTTNKVQYTGVPQSTFEPAFQNYLGTNPAKVWMAQENGTQFANLFVQTETTSGIVDPVYFATNAHNAGALVLNSDLNGKVDMGQTVGLANQINLATGWIGPGSVTLHQDIVSSPNYSGGVIVGESNGYWANSVVVGPTTAVTNNYDFHSTADAISAGGTVTNNYAFAAGNHGSTATTFSAAFFADTQTIADGHSWAFYNATGKSLISAAEFISGAPTVSSGFGTGASVTAGSSHTAFRVGVGTSNTGTGVVALPTAPTGWNCYATDITTKSTLVASTLQTASTTASATFQNYTDIVGTHAWVDSDVLAISCFAY